MQHLPPTHGHDQQQAYAYGPGGSWHAAPYEPQYEPPHDPFVGDPVSGIELEPMPLLVQTHRSGRATRLRWDNLLIVMAAVAVCVVAVPKLLAWSPAGDRPRPVDATADSSATADEGATTTSSMTLADATQRVAQARSELQAGRFDAADRLVADISGDISDSSGAGQLRNEIAVARETYEHAAETARAAVQSQRWADAAKALDAAAAVAPLTSSLAQLKEQVDEQLGSRHAADLARQQLDRQQYDKALKTAVRAYDRYRTVELRNVLKRIERAIRQAQAQRQAVSGGGAAGGGAAGGGAAGGAPVAAPAASGSPASASRPATAAPAAAAGAAAGLNTESLRELGIDPALLKELQSILAGGGGDLGSLTSGLEGLESLEG